MAHFAKLETGNKVAQVLVVYDDIATTEQAGIDFLNNLYKTIDVWKQTSYNTYGGVHYKANSREPSEEQNKALRKNYAGIGYTYDSDRDAFIPQKPYNSWLLDEPTCTWEAPVPQPEGNYIWNEETQSWNL